VLRFQASWCKACAAQAAGLERVYERYKARDVEVVAIHVDDPEPNARAFLKAHRAGYPAALDPGLLVANRFGFKRAPYTVIVNKRGEIATRLDATADEARLRAAQPEQVTVVGVCTDICVLHTVADLRNRDYRVVVPASAVETFDGPGHPGDEVQRWALAHLKGVLGAHVIPA